MHIVVTGIPIQKGGNNMKRTTEFILGLSGSILGLLGALFWLYMGTYFWAGFISGSAGGYLDDYVGKGFVIAFIQFILTVPFLIMTLLKSLTPTIEQQTVQSGKWMLVVGIVILFLNAFLLVSSALLIVAGSLCLRKPSLTQNQ